MSSTKLKRAYKCWNDCVQSGCPGHVATLEYQSASETFHFADGKRSELYGGTPELEVLISMVGELSGYHVEIENILKRNRHDN